MAGRVTYEERLQLATCSERQGDVKNAIKHLEIAERCRECVGEELQHLKVWKSRLEKSQ